jgi:Mrp family chromosome partitioning ATPase
MLAVKMRRQGYRTAVLDADITGPSIPKTFGLQEKAQGSEMGLLPVKSKTGIDIMSINLLLPADTDPVVWRGPVIASAVKQFWTDVIWYDVDYMFVDMPPGTGDVPLTVFQSIPVDGIIVVTSPQELVSMIVTKAVKMAEMMNVPILGLIENMSYFKCRTTGKSTRFSAKATSMILPASISSRCWPESLSTRRYRAACDRGAVELVDGDWLDEAAALLVNNEG